MANSPVISFILIQDCLDDATYAINSGNHPLAVSYVTLAKQRLKELVIELKTTKQNLDVLEACLNTQYQEQINALIQRAEVLQDQTALSHHQGRSLRSRSEFTPSMA
jgi:hypothetical protein